MTSSSDATTTILTSAPAASAPGAEGGPRPIPTTRPKAAAPRASQAVAAVAAAPAAIEELPVSLLPEPDRLPVGDPDVAAPVPGPAAGGDVRSLRSAAPGGTPRFAVVYCKGTTLVVASGPVGRRGRWHAVEYPTNAAAGTAYARACAAFIADGYVDL